jgi:hypothetical protein
MYGDAADRLLRMNGKYAIGNNLKLKLSNVSYNLDLYRPSAFTYWEESVDTLLPNCPQIEQQRGML